MEEEEGTGSPRTSMVLNRCAISPSPTTVIFPEASHQSSELPLLEVWLILPLSFTISQAAGHKRRDTVASHSS